MNSVHPRTQHRGRALAGTEGEMLGVPMSPRTTESTALRWNKVLTSTVTLAMLQSAFTMRNPEITGPWNVCPETARRSTCLPHTAVQGQTMDGFPIFSLLSLSHGNYSVILHKVFAVDASNFLTEPSPVWDSISHGTHRSQCESQQHRLVPIPWAPSSDWWAVSSCWPGSVSAFLST